LNNFDKLKYFSIAEQPNILLTPC